MEMASGPIAALESAPIAVAMRQELWLYPIVEIAHITGFVVLVGSIVVLDLRLLGLNPVALGARARAPRAAVDVGALLRDRADRASHVHGARIRISSAIALSR